MKTAPVVSIVLALSALTASPSFAAGSASVSTGPLFVSLIDIDPLDGITPSITFFQNGWEQSSIYVDAGNVFRSTNGLSGYAPISDAVSGAGSTAVGAVNGDGTASGATLSASATSPDVYSLASNAWTGGYGNSSAYGSFKLSSGTLAIFSISFTAAVSGAGIYQDAVWNVYGEDAGAWASIQVSGPGAFGADDSYQSSEAEGGAFIEAQVSGPLIPYDRAVSQSLKVTFLNLTSGDLTGDLELEAYAHSSSNALPPVPEPGTHAMLLAGLAAVGFVLRRKRA